MQLTAPGTDSVCELVLDLCGIYLDEGKAYLIENRLTDVMRRHGCSDYGELAQRVRLSLEPQLQSEIVDAITTNETSFFRDETPFDLLKSHVLPELIARKAESSSKRLNLWSAACSTGQEPYSLAMILPRRRQFVGYHHSSDRCLAHRDREGRPRLVHFASNWTRPIWGPTDEVLSPLEWRLVS